MGKRGPKKTPAKITRLKGNPGRRSGDVRELRVPDAVDGAHEERPDGAAQSAELEMPQWLGLLRPPDDLESKTLAELRELARREGIARISRLAKGPLIAAIREHRGDERTREWSWLVPLLKKMGLATPVDAPALAMLIDQYVLYREARLVVQREGMTYETTNKHGDQFIRARPEGAIADRALARVKAFMALYGMTASDRTGMGDEREEDPLEGLRNAGRYAG